MARITLNRPDRLNSFGDDLLADLQGALSEVDRNDAVRAIVLTGAGRSFCAGEDLREFEPKARDTASARRHVAAIQNVTRRLMHSSKIIIAAAHGYAVGGGFEWLLNCDLVVAADNLVAFFPEMDWAQFPTGGISWLLPRSVGYQRAIELVVLGERQTAGRLQELGLVNWVVPQDRMLPMALEVADRIASKPGFSVARFKKLVNQDLFPLARALDLEEQATVEAFGRPEAARRAARFASRKRR